MNSAEVIDVDANEQSTVELIVSSMAEIIADSLENERRLTQTELLRMTNLLAWNEVEKYRNAYESVCRHIREMFDRHSLLVDLSNDLMLSATPGDFEDGHIILRDADLTLHFDMENTRMDLMELRAMMRNRRFELRQPKERTRRR